MNQPIRINAQQTEHIIEQLWQTSESRGEPMVQIILDGARNKKIYPLLDASKANYYCLFEDQLDYGMALAAPYVVRLEKTSDFTRDLIQQAWGNSWGVFAITYQATAFIHVHIYCQDILHVWDEENQRKLLFRYYDPRILRHFLPTFTEEDRLNQFFGPITHYMMESENATHLVKYTRIKNQTTCSLNDSMIPLFEQSALITSQQQNT